MAKKYPRIYGYRRKPDKEKDGGKNYGKPCVICSKGTRGEKWLQTSYMRGDDEVVRVCADHWKECDELIMDAAFKDGGAQNDR